MMTHDDHCVRVGLCEPYLNTEVKGFAELQKQAVGNNFVSESSLWSSIPVADVQDHSYTTASQNEVVQ